MGIEEQVRGLVDKAIALPLGTRVLTGLVLVFSGLLALLRIFALLPTSVGAAYADGAVHYPYLVVVPGQVLWFPWTLLTAAFCETSIVEFLVSIGTVPLAAAYLEQHWGAVELLQFTAIVVVVSNVIASGLSVLMFMVLRTDKALFGTQFHGLEALQTGFLVAFAQLIPQHQIQLFGSRIAVHVRDLPMLYVGFSNVMCLLGFMSPYLLIQFGWLVAWVYLRFYQLGEMGVRGDRSDTFAFIHWFPPFVHKPLGKVTALVHSIVMRLGLVPRWATEYTDLELNVDATTTHTASARAEAERRRAMALEALDQRMAGADTKAPLPEEPAQKSGETSNATSAT